MWGFFPVRNRNSFILAPVKEEFVERTQWAASQASDIQGQIGGEVEPGLTRVDCDACPCPHFS